MVVSTTTQLDSTYKLWQRFTFPTEKGPRDAIAVPKLVGDELNSAYALIIDLAILQFWNILFGTILYFYMRRQEKKKSKLNPLAPVIWNKKGDLIDLILGTITSSNIEWRRLKVLLLLLLIFVAWVGQKAAGTLVPPLLLLGNAAPVNPGAIYVPDTTGQSNASRAALFALEVPRFLRALGSTSLGEELRRKVNISTPRSMGQTDGQDIQQIDYWYRATGVDFGLQNFPGLTLNVAGSCVTEYGWLVASRAAEFNDEIIALDSYNVFGGMATVSLLDGRQPSATFWVGDNAIQGTLATSNATWAAVVSSVNRTSFTAGTDPWYLTAPGQSETGAGYSVLQRRPVLSCWQDDVWSYQGRNSTVDNLTGEALPGLGLSEGLQGILASVLGVPMIQIVGQHLQASALLSSTTANGQIFNAEASNIHNDLERLVQAAYVATVNCLTDLTLYPAGANLPNIAHDDSDQPMSGVADFVVWSPEVATLSTVVVIVVPSVFLGIWLFATVLLYGTPMKDVNDLTSDVSPQTAKIPDAVSSQQQGSTGNQSTIDPKQGTTLTPEHEPSKTSMVVSP